MSSSETAFIAAKLQKSSLSLKRFLQNVAEI
jgi:hypothetical protein